MKLTLSVPLIWMLFSSAEALKCVQYYPRSAGGSKVPRPCNSELQCSTVAFQHIKDNEVKKNITTMTCAQSSFCSDGDQSLSISYDVYKMTASLQCCSTDGCNNKDIPYLDEQKPNGLQCFTRYPWAPSDLGKLQCMGIEDRCIQVNETEYGVIHPIYGCASANLCESHAKLKLMAVYFQSVLGDADRLSAPRCCETSLCNSAPADRLSVFSLLFALAALSVC